jgi:glutamine synthetase
MRPGAAMRLWPVVYHFFKGLDVPLTELMTGSTDKLFGANVFHDGVMRERLPKNAYRALRRTIAEGSTLDDTIADIVANAIKDWAIEKGATHFTHWFQPMTGLTAEKHDSFISPTGDGRVLMEFSGKELIQGEPDASSFPSGGLRATFEARGYTAWDCTSPVFVKKDGDNMTLFIPSAFCSYTGEALDKKTPLLRSMAALEKQALRTLRALGDTETKRVTATLGGEQEYFLVDKDYFQRRLDLQMCGRTLFGAPAPKGQEMEDHYFGKIHDRVASFMADLNNELWRLGVTAKTQHNEVAPGQYEIAPVFESINVACDHNHLTMQTLERVAARHGFVCLLHEKPFAGVNGSGKHNNWSLVTDTGANLLNPGDTPHDNMKFLVFLFAIVRAVDTYAQLLRASVATPGNDHRLGANEAPPAIISVFLGDQLTDIFEQIKNGGATSSRAGGEIKLGVNTLPRLPKDCTDRNRTSPFAFTGNKFEFRMAGSAQSLNGPNFVLNTIVADVLKEIADRLGAVGDDALIKEVNAMLSEFAREHERVIFNGDGYAAHWHEEAQKRGLPNLRDTVSALEIITNKENAAVLSRHKVLSRAELKARQEILFEHYYKTIMIEARCTLSMARRQILPAALDYSVSVSSTVVGMTEAGVAPAAQKRILEKLNTLTEQLAAAIEALEEAIDDAAKESRAAAGARLCRDSVRVAMGAVREAADALEEIVDSELWPLPTYAEMLFNR